MPIRTRGTRPCLADGESDIGIPTDEVGQSVASKMFDVRPFRRYCNPLCGANSDISPCSWTTSFCTSRQLRRVGEAAPPDVAQRAQAGPNGPSARSSRKPAPLEMFRDARRPTRAISALLLSQNQAVLWDPQPPLLPSPSSTSFSACRPSAVQASNHTVLAVLQLSEKIHSTRDPWLTVRITLPVPRKASTAPISASKPAMIGAASRARPRLLSSNAASISKHNSYSRGTYRQLNVTL